MSPPLLRLREPKSPLEKGVYEEVVRLFTLAGCAVYRLSQMRASRQTPGLPDLWIFGPPPFCCWFEVKSLAGKLRPAQQLFRERCLARGVTHLVGGVEQAKWLLTAWGLLVDGVLRPWREVGR